LIEQLIQARLIDTAKVVNIGLTGGPLDCLKDLVPAAPMPCANERSPIVSAFPADSHDGA
jgi:hypothetical protein